MANRRNRLYNRDRRRQMSTTHGIKHLKRCKRELLFWRKMLCRSLDYVRNRLYDPDEIEEVTDAVAKDYMSIVHIDSLLKDLDDWFGDETELSKVTPPRVRELDRMKVDGKIYHVEKGTTEEQIRETFTADFEVRP